MTAHAPFAVVPPDELPVELDPMDGLAGDASDPQAPAMAAPPTAVSVPRMARRLNLRLERVFM
jgi:hypothetical protein